VLDTALARTPMERYQSVAKFAADVAAITGRPGPAAVPQTRAPADPEGKTQLLDATAGATQRISAKKPPPAPVPPRKKRAFVPALVAAFVVLAGGGAWVVLSGGSADPRKGGADGAAADTSRAANDTVTLRGTQLGNRTTPPAPPPPARTNALSNATATDSLDALFDKIDDLSGGMLRDAARDIYNAAGMSDQNRAMAAYLTANGFAKLDDRTRMCDWAQLAVGLAPQSQPYRALQQEACR
jgi:hypothetical protein